MADNTTLNPGTGGDVIATDDVAGVKYQVVKIDVGADGAAAPLGNANPIPVSDAGGALTVDGTVAVSGTVAVTDNAGSLTVDNAALAVTGGGVEASALRVTLASDSTGVVSVDDNGSTLSIDDGGGVITVDGTVGVSGTVTVGSHAVTNAGTFATQVDGAALTSLQLIDDTVFAEDTAAQAADKGIAILAVRRDADTSLVGTDNDYANLQVNAAGSLKVAITAGAGSGGTSIADGASFTRDTTSITPAGAAVETSAPTLTNGDVAALSMTTAGALRVAVASGGVVGVLEDAASAGGEEGVLMLGVRRDTAASSSGTDGDFSTLNLDSTGRLHVNVGNTVTVSSHAVTNAGTFVVQENGSALTALQLIDNACIADDAAFTPATTGVHMAGFTADESSTDSVDEGDGGAARMTLDRKQIVTQYAHAAAGGWTPYKNLDCDETEDDIKTSAGKLGWIHVINRSTGVRYIKFYNATAANVTVGTTTPVLSFPVPTMADTNGAGFCVNFGDAGTQFDTAISVAATTGVADNDTGAPGANDVVLNAGYL